MKEKITCTYIGHATTLITIGAASVLTDPHFGKHTLFFKRHTPLTYDAAKLPPLSAVLISHTHFDHLNIGSFKYIPKNEPVIVPEGCSGAISKFVENPIIELALFAAHELPDGLKITAVPAKHRGGRYSQLRFTHTCSYLIQKDESVVYFGCDSGYGPEFTEIAQTAKIDLALVPIAGYLPRWLMRGRHMTPSEAVEAFEDLGARHMIPIHWGSFSLSLEPIGQPIEKLGKILEDRPDLKDRIHIVPHGENMSVE
jgi:N-acyl-phosphatidylethanolamine-hydrolysing phospholipase D